MIRDEVTAYFEARRDELTARLARLTEIPSLSAPAEEGKPFGREVDRALSLAEELFKEEGFSTVRAAGGEYVLASFGEGDRTVGIFAHADVVPAGEGWEVTEPFSPVVKDGLLVARGAEDNKGGIVAALYLLMALRDLLPPPHVRFLVFVGGNEESGMLDISAFLASHAAPDVSLVPDNDPPLSLGEKGRAECWLVSPPVFTDILDFRGGNAYNVVLDTATVTLSYTEALLASLEGLCAGREDVTLSHQADEGVIRLTAKGRAAHASQPEGSRNAAAVAADLLSFSDALSPDERAALTAASLYLSDPFGGTLGISGEDGTFGRRTAASGMVRLYEGRLYLSEDIRYGAEVSWEDLCPSLLDALEEEDFELVLGSAHDGFDTREGDALAEGLLSAYERVVGTAASPYRSGGGTYARHLPRAFSMGLSVPGVGALPEEILGKGHGMIHGPDEAISIDSFLAALRVLYEYAVTCAEYIKNE